VETCLFWVLRRTSPHVCRRRRRRGRSSLATRRTGDSPTGWPSVASMRSRRRLSSRGFTGRRRLGGCVRVEREYAEIDHLQGLCGRSDSRATAHQYVDSALYSSVRSGAGRPSDAPVLGRRHLPEEVRRSLKTQQHAHPRPTLGRDGVSRFELRRTSSSPRSSSSTVPRPTPSCAPEPVVYLGSSAAT
jgi:hypothetical protein